MSAKEQAIAKYREFHQLEPRKVGAFDAAFEIPHEVACWGRAVHVMYRSGKVDPETGRKPSRPLDYIHDHDAGVQFYTPLGGDEEDAEVVEVPEWIRETTALTLLGQCLGYRFCDEVTGQEVDGLGKAPLPELYCTPCGRALVVVQGKREVVAMMWGGLLDVQDRGIVG